MFVLVTGGPASGKTTLATLLAPELGLPLIGKDVIKEALMDALGTPADVEGSRALGGAAVRAMIAVARANSGAVLDSVWHPYTLPLIAQLPPPIVEVHCEVPLEVAQERYGLRAHHRHPGHLGSARPAEELWDPRLRRPLEIGPIVRVDTGATIDAAAVTRAVRAAAVDAGARS